MHFVIYKQINVACWLENFFWLLYPAEIEAPCQFCVVLPFIASSVECASADVAYGSVITLKSHRTGGMYLHSHPHLYPDSVGMPLQQVLLLFFCFCIAASHSLICQCWFWCHEDHVVNQSVIDISSDHVSLR